MCTIALLCLVENKKKTRNLKGKQESEKEDIRKQDLQDLKKQSEKAKRKIASLDKKIRLISKMKKVSK